MIVSYKKVGTCLAYFALFLKQAAHFFSHSRIYSLAAMIQYFADNADKVWLVPALCFPNSRYDLTINLVTLLFLGNIMRNFTHCLVKIQHIANDCLTSSVHLHQVLDIIQEVYYSLKEEIKTKYSSLPPVVLSLSTSFLNFKFFQ